MAHYGSFFDLSSLNSDELVAQDAHAAARTRTHEATKPVEGHRQDHGHENHEHGADEWCDANSDDQSEGEQGDDRNWWDEFTDECPANHPAMYGAQAGAATAPKRKQRHSDPGTYTLSMASVVSKQERCNSLRRRILLRSTVQHVHTR